MSAGKAVGNLLEELLKKDSASITLDSVMGVLKGAGKGKDGYSLSHATSKLEQRFTAPKSNMEFNSFKNPNKNFVSASSPGPSSELYGDKSILEKAYSSFFMKDVDEDMYRSFRGSLSGYEKGMKTRLDKEGRLTGDFYKPKENSSTLKQVQYDRNKMYSSSYIEDQEYVKGGREIYQKISGGGSVSPSALESQKKLYQRKAFGSESISSGPVRMTDQQKKALEMPKNSQKKRKLAKSMGVSVNELGRLHRQAKGIKHKVQKEMPGRAKILEAEHIETFGSIKEVKSKRGKSHYRVKGDDAKYRTKERAKMALQSKEQSLRMEYGPAYFDKSVREKRMMPIVHRASEVGFSNIQTGIQKKQALEKRVAELKKSGMSQTDIESKLYEGSYGATNKKIMSSSTEDLKDTMYGEIGGRGLIGSDDQFVSVVKKAEAAKDRAAGVNRNEEFLKKASAAGYNRDNVIEFIESKGHSRSDAYSVMSLKETKSGMFRMQYQSDMVSQRTRVREDGSVTRTSGTVRMNNPTDLKKRIVSERNRRSNSILDADENFGSYSQRIEQPAAEAGGVGSVQTGSQPTGNRLSQDEMVDYVTTEKYSNKMNEMMKSQIASPVAGGMIGGGGTMLFSWDSNESFGSNMSRVAKNTAIGAGGGYIGKSVGKAVFETGAKKGGFISNIMTGADTYAKHNPDSVFKQPLSSFASQRGNMYGNINANGINTRIQKLAEGTRNSMYAGIGLGSATSLTMFGSGKQNKSSGLNQKRGNKF